MAGMISTILNLWLDEHANYEKGNWSIVCQPTIHSFIQDFDIFSLRMERYDTDIGYRVDEFHSKVGKTFSILSERYTWPGTLIVVNLDAFKYGYYVEDCPTRRGIPTQGPYQCWFISFKPMARWLPTREPT